MKIFSMQLGKKKCFITKFFQVAFILSDRKYFDFTLLVTFNNF